MILKHNGNSYIIPQIDHIAVHPHACGEHVRRLVSTDHHSRFIPTHVGNTNRKRHNNDFSAVHPHACGEHVALTPFIHPACGSSPRMWGTLHHPSYCTIRNRFIPTHVGNTKELAVTVYDAAVHPHACGEHDRDFLRAGHAVRFIPTHVGNTRTALHAQTM